MGGGGGGGGGCYLSCQTPCFVISSRDGKYIIIHIYLSWTGCECTIGVSIGEAGFRERERV